MQNAFDEITQAIRDARSLQSVVKRQSNNLAELLTPNLRSVDAHALRELKHELQSFNATTGKWRK